MVARAWGIAALATFVLAGCGASEESPSGAPEKPPGPMQTQSAAEAAKRLPPEVSVPDELPKQKLVVEDLIEGSGRPIRMGDKIVTHFVAVHADGELYEHYWKANPFQYQLARNYVLIPAWTEALPGMRVGGRRRLVAHPDHLFIGGAPPDVTAEEWTLYYVIDLLGIVKPK